MANLKNKNDKIKITSTCRTCLQQAEGCIKIFDIEPEMGITLADMLRAFTKLRIQYNDKLPKRICNMCTKTIKIAYKFTEISEKSEQFLFDYLNKKPIINDLQNNSTPKIKNESDQNDLIAPDTSNVEVVVKVEMSEESNLEGNNLQETTNPINTLENSFEETNLEEDNNVFIEDNSDGNNSDENFDETNVEETKIDDNFEGMTEKITNNHKSKGKLKDASENNKNEESLESNPKKRRRKISDNIEERTCNICNKTLINKTSLKRHLSLHEGEKKKYECDICHSKFSLESNMRKHKKIFHDEKNSHKRNAKQVCDYCGMAVASILVHMRVHTGERPHKCEVCGRGFSQKCGLTIHRRVHTGERPYLCTICGKGFQKTYNLKNHIRIHTGDKPNKCTYCDRAFIFQKDLRKHLLMHSGTKAFECADCGLGFKSKNALTNHCKTKDHSVLEKC